LSARWRGALLPDLAQLLTLFNLDTQQGILYGFPSDSIAQGLAPLTLLLAGLLLLNLDRLVGWLIAMWIIAAVVVGSALTAETVTWPAFLPLLPALALGLAFTLDRIRLGLIVSAGTWTAQAATYLALGLVVWAGLGSWAAYQSAIQTESDSASVLGQVLRTLPAARAPFLVVEERPNAVNWQTPAVQFLAGGQVAPATQGVLMPGAWPPQLPAQSTILLAPSERGLLDELTLRYPGGAVTTVRDPLANPVLYLYALP
jgi:hypothetical protein